jgi:acyl-CoA hydrolase
MNASENYVQMLCALYFLQSVSIGSLMEFGATVVYSEDSQIVVRVEAHQIDVGTGNKMKTNNFVYVFE